MKHVAVALSLISAWAGASIAADPVQRLLTYVPEDAAIIVIVPSLENLAAGLAAFGQNTGVEGWADLDARVLLEELELVDVVDGLNAGGPVVLALSPGPPAPALLMTVKDAALWQRAVGVAPGSTGVFAVNAAESSRFAALAGDVLILASDDLVVRRALAADGKAGKRLQTGIDSLLGSHQLVVQIEVAPWRPMLAAATAALQVSMRAGMAASGQTDEATLHIVDWIVGRCVEVLGQVESCTAAARVNADGISSQLTAKFQPGGPVAAYLGKLRRAEGDLFRGLVEDEEIWCVVANEWELPSGTKSLDALWLEGLLSTRELKARLGGEAFQKGLKATLAMYEQLSGYSVAMKSGPRGGLVLTGLYLTNQPQPVLESMRCSMEISPEFMDALRAGSAMQVACRTESLGSAAAHVFEMAFTVEDERSRGVLEAMYGTTTTMWAAPHPEGVAYAMGPGDAARAELARLLAEDSPRLAKSGRVRAAMERLSPKPQVCVLLDLPGATKFALSLSRATGAPVPQIEFAGPPTDLAAFGGYLGEAAIRFEGYVPADAVRALVRTFRTVGQSVADRH